MKLHEFLFEIARQTTNVEQSDLAKLKEKADKDTAYYTEDDKNPLKRMYVKTQKGWMLPLVLMLSLPLVVAWITKTKNKIMFGSNDDSNLDEFENDIEPSFFDKSKFL